jgi:hypothetical protein
MTVKIADALALRLRLISIVKMATVLEEVTIEEQRCLCVFWGGSKGLNVKNIHKEMFPIYGGKCLSRKAVHNWM